VGVLGRLLGLFGRGKKAKTPASDSLDRTPFRPRVEALLRQLQVPASDTMTRLTQLRTLLPELESLFRDLVTAGDRHESVEQMGKVLVLLRTVLLEAAPAASAIDQFQLNLVTAMQKWLALEGQGPPPPSGRRDGFWK
jgi:hypothetical protein